MDDAPTESLEKKPPLNIALPTRVVITILLALSGLLFQGYNLSLAFDPDDSNHLETTLTLAIAREVTHGPEALYGPFSGENPLVLIHAPLYYRLAALGAWPLLKARFDPAIAAMIAGRAISFLGMLLTVAAAAWIAGMDGSSWFARIWAASLIASAGVFASFPASVRPDTLAVGLQTLGFALVLRTLRDGGRLAPFAAFLLFAMTFGTKQNLAVAAAVAAFFLMVAGLGGRVKWRFSLTALMLGAILAVGYYAAEDRVTHGQMFRAVFSIPSRLGATAEGRGSWSYVGTVSWEVAKRSVGLLFLGLILMLTAPRRIIGTKLDGRLWLVLVAETLPIVPFCLRSSGAWVNYAMPAAVWGAILLARWVVRASEDLRIGLRPVLLVLASLVVFFSVYRLVRNSHDPRQGDRLLLAELLDDPAVRRSDRSAVYFVALPQFNRMYGNPGLAHDEWLYNNFEGLGEAEPRDRWLRAALVSTTHLVVVPAVSRPGVVPGVSGELTDLGYRQVRQIGHYALWSRDKDEHED